MLLFKATMKLLSFLIVLLYVTRVNTQHEGLVAAVEDATIAADGTASEVSTEDAGDTVSDAGIDTELEGTDEYEYVDSSSSQQQQQQEIDATTVAPTAATAFSKLFGDVLWKWNPENSQEILQMSTDELLQGKAAIGVYFSASWCGPCRQFTPQLAEFYKEMQQRGKPFEVVWVSRDHSAEDFVSYFQHMPWLALPMDAVEGFMQTAASRFQVRGIPHLVLLDGDDASVLSLDGRSKVLKDKYGLEFPYRPRTLINMLPGPLRRAAKKQLRQLKQQMQNLLRGALQGAVPAKLLNKLLPQQQ